MVHLAYSSCYQKDTVPMHLTESDLCIIENNNRENIDVVKFCLDKNPNSEHEIYCVNNQERDILFQNNQCMKTNGHPNVNKITGYLTCDDRIYETKNICGRYYAVEINGGDAARLLGLKDSGRVSSRVEQYCNFFSC